MDSPGDWRRRAGRPRQSWLRTVEADLRPMNLGLATAKRRAQDRSAWRLLVATATSSKSSWRREEENDEGREGWIKADGYRPRLDESLNTLVYLSSAPRRPLSYHQHSVDAKVCINLEDSGQQLPDVVRDLSTEAEPRSATRPTNAHSKQDDATCECT